MATRQFLTFGQALDALVSHRAVTIARDGWDGVLFLEDQPSPYMHVTGREPKRHPVLVYAGGKEWEHHPGWAPSQADMMAGDWYVSSGPVTRGEL